MTSTRGSHRCCHVRGISSRCDTQGVLTAFVTVRLAALVTQTAEPDRVRNNCPPGWDALVGVTGSRCGRSPGLGTHMCRYGWCCVVLGYAYVAALGYSRSEGRRV
jgi:hypothetical protein